MLLTVAAMIKRDKEPPTWTLRWSVFTPIARLQFKKLQNLHKMHGHIQLRFAKDTLEQAFFVLLLPIHLCMLLSLPDQQRLVFHFTTHLHVPVPPVRDVLQQRHLLNMDAPSCSG